MIFFIRPGFMIGWDERKRHDERSTIPHKAFFEEDFETNVTQYFRSYISKLIAQSSLRYPDSRRSIDIVRDVTNVVPMLWLAQRFAIPLKPTEQPRGLITRSQLFDIYLVMFIYQSFNILPANDWKLPEAASAVAPLLLSFFEAHLKTQHGGPRESVVDFLAKGSAFEVGPSIPRSPSVPVARGGPRRRLHGHERPCGRQPHATGLRAH